MVPLSKQEKNTDIIIKTNKNKLFWIYLGYNNYKTYLIIVIFDGLYF